MRSRNISPQELQEMIDLESLSEQFGSVRILVFGDVMVDRYLNGSVDRISPEAPVPVVRLESERVIAGGAANVALNVKGLGASVELVSVVGHDSDAEHLIKLLSDAGIATDGIIGSKQRPTTVKTRVMAGSHQIARIDSEAVADLDMEESEGVLERVMERLEQCDALVISDYGKGVATSILTSRLITAAAGFSIPVLVDPKGLNYSKYKGATTLTPNKKEAWDVFHSETKRDCDVETAGAYLVKGFELDEAVVTLGADGMALFSKDDEPHFLKASARNVFDVTGAGDTVIGTLAVAKAAGFDLRTSALIANFAAGQVVERIGTTAIKFDDLLDVLSSVEFEDSQGA